MPTYTVAIADEALKTLAKLPARAQARIVQAIDALAQNPRPSGVKKLKGKDGGRWRIRVGDYRVVYEIEDRALRVLIIRLGTRGDIYR